MWVSYRASADRDLGNKRSSQIWSLLQKNALKKFFSQNRRRVFLPLITTITWLNGSIAGHFFSLPLSWRLSVVVNTTPELCF